MELVPKTVTVELKLGLVKLRKDLKPLVKIPKLQMISHLTVWKSLLQTWERIQKPSKETYKINLQQRIVENQWLSHLVLSISLIIKISFLLIRHLNMLQANHHSPLRKTLGAPLPLQVLQIIQTSNWDPLQLKTLLEIQLKEAKNLKMKEMGPPMREPTPIQRRKLIEKVN